MNQSSADLYTLYNLEFMYLVVFQFKHVDSNSV